MLRALTIENVAVAKSFSIELSPGFTVLTGKTGAGKSVIMDSISMLLGAKGQRELIRSGESTARITAVFLPSPQAAAELVQMAAVPDADGEITLERSFTSDGRSTARLNGRSVPMAMLREVGARLVSMHGQNETVTLYDKSEYVRILDCYAGCGQLSERYAAEFSRLSAKKKELEDFKESLGDKSMLTEILSYQKSEIDKAKLNDPDEEEKLERLRAKMKNSEQITKSAILVTRALAPSEKGASAAYLLERASAALLHLGDAMEGAADMSARLDEYRCDIIDIAERARELAQDTGGDDPERSLDKIEARLSLIGRLKHKYGATIEDILQFREAAKKKLEAFDESEIRTSELEREIKALESEAKNAAAKLSEARRSAAVSLTREVMESLKYLDMPKVRFTVEIRASDSLGRTGADDVDFSVATNPGEPLQSLGRIASGGELARIMLALKCAQARQAGTETIVFDEIDTGVSGSTAERIGIKLSELSRSAQVICVTHSPQVSAHALTHCLIEKSEVDGRAESTVRILGREEREAELARMIGGINVTEKQLLAARDLLDNNKI